MKKVFIILPSNITEKIITQGFAQGFRDLGFFTIEKDVNKINVSDFENFMPDYIFNYNYGYLENEKISKSLEKKHNYKFIHYFGDEHDLEFAYCSKSRLYTQLKEQNSSIFLWDPELTKEIKDAKYIPLAVNAKLYKTNFSFYKRNISFIGEPSSLKCLIILTRLVQKYRKINIFCDQESFHKSVNLIKENKLLNKDHLEDYKNSYVGNAVKEREVADIYNSSKININITDQGKNNINYRVFEALASSGFMITDDMEEIHTNFEIGREIEVYKNFEDLTDKIYFYLKNLNITQTIARKGRKTIVNNHNFKMRVEKILKTLQ